MRASSLNSTLPCLPSHWPASTCISACRVPPVRGHCRLYPAEFFGPRGIFWERSPFCTFHAFSISPCGLAGDSRSRAQADIKVCLPADLIHGYGSFKVQYPSGSGPAAVAAATRLFHVPSSWLKPWIHSLLAQQVSPVVTKVCRWTFDSCNSLAM